MASEKQFWLKLVKSGEIRVGKEEVDGRTRADIKEKRQRAENKKFEKETLEEQRKVLAEIKRIGKIEDEKDRKKIIDNLVKTLLEGVIRDNNIVYKKIIEQVRFFSVMHKEEGLEDDKRLTSEVSEYLKDWKRNDFEYFNNSCYQEELNLTTNPEATKSEVEKQKFYNTVERYKNGEEITDDERKMVGDRLEKADWARIFNNLDVNDKVVTLLAPSQSYVAVKTLNDHIFGMLGTDDVLLARNKFSEQEFNSIFNKEVSEEAEDIFEKMGIAVEDLILEQNFKFGVFRIPASLEKKINENGKNLTDLLNNLCRKVDLKMTYLLANMISEKLKDSGILKEFGGRIPEYEELEEMEGQEKKEKFKKLVGFIDDLNREGFRIDFGISRVRGLLDDNNKESDFASVKEKTVAVAQAMQMSLVQSTKATVEGAPKLEGIEKFRNKKEGETDKDYRVALRGYLKNLPEENISYGQEYDEKGENFKKHIIDFKKLQLKIYTDNNFIIDKSGVKYKVFRGPHESPAIDKKLIALVRKEKFEPLDGKNRQILIMLRQYYKYINVWDMMRPFNSAETRDNRFLDKKTNKEVKGIGLRAKETKNLVDDFKKGNDKRREEIAKKILHHEKDPDKFYAQHYFKTMASGMGNRIILSMDVLNAAPLQIVDDFEAKLNEAHNFIKDLEEKNITNEEKEIEFDKKMASLTIKSGDKLTNLLKNTRTLMYNKFKEAKLLDDKDMMPGMTAGDEYFIALSEDALKKEGMLGDTGTNDKFNQFLFDIQESANVRIAVAEVKADPRALTSKATIQEEMRAENKTEEIIDVEKEIELALEKLDLEMKQRLKMLNKEQRAERIKKLGVSNIWGRESVDKDGKKFFQFLAPGEGHGNVEYLSFEDIIDRIYISSVNILEESMVVKGIIQGEEREEFLEWCLVEWERCKKGTPSEIYARFKNKKIGAGRKTSRF